MRFKRLVLKDDPLFGNAELVFEPGITVLYGLNKLSKASRNGNFAGKSYLMSQVPEIPWEQPIHGTRDDRNKLGTRELDIEIGDRSYTLSRGSKLQVYEGGELKFKNVKDTKAWISKLPISESDFLGLYYLDSRKSHPLVTGTSPERAAYLSKFFNLDRIDAERKLITQKLAELRTVKAQADEVDAAIEQLRASKPSGKAGDPAKLSAKLSKLQKRQERYLTYQRAVDFAKAVRPSLQVLSDAIDFEDPKQLTDKNFRHATKTAKLALKEDARTLKTARKYATYQEQLLSYQEAIKSLTKEEQRALGSRLSYRKAYEEFKSVDPVKPGAKPKPPRKVKPFEGDLTSLELSAKELEHELSHARKFKAGKCPTCGSKVKARSLSTIKQELRKARSDLAAGRKQQEAFEEYKEDKELYEKEYAQWKSDCVSYRKAVAKRKKLREKARIYKAIQDVPDRPAPFTGQKLQLEVVEEMVRRGERKLEALELLRPSLGLLRALLKGKQRDFSAKIQKLHTELAEVKAYRAARKSYKKQLSSLLSRKAELQRSLGDEPALQLLAQAYNEKGMKRMAIEAVTVMLTQQLNKYSSLVFPDNYQFSIEWNKSKLSILCHRPTGKVKTTDVRKLSGAESRLFTYLLVFAQLQFVPKARRSNLMILDEPTTNMHTETAEAFKSALKLLHTIIPSIIVITPQSSEFYDDATCLTVVRAKGKSKIVRGHPQTLP